MKEKFRLFIDKINSTWKDKEKRKHLMIVIFVVLVMAAIITVVRDRKTTVNDIEIQYTGIIVEEYGTDADIEEETTAPEGTEPPAVPEEGTAAPEGTEPPAVPEEGTPAPEGTEPPPVTEETSVQIFFLEETTAPQ